MSIYVSGGEENDEESDAKREGQLKIGSHITLVKRRIKFRCLQYQIKATYQATVITFIKKTSFMKKKTK